MPDTEAGTSQRFEFEHPAMGILFTATIYAEDRTRAARAIEEGWKTVDEMEMILSDYRRDSEVMRLTATAPHEEPVKVSRELYEFLQISVEFSKMTDGAFDVSIGPSSRLWRAAIKRNRLPDDSAVSKASNAVGWEQIRFVPPQSVQITKPGASLDFGGIAQGMAIDRIAAILHDHGIESALINASGDIVTFGPRGGNDKNRDGSWSVEIPGAGVISPFSIPLRDCAITTSGDTEQALVVDGIRYSHIVNPGDGRAVTHCSLATVIAPDATMADALASACCVLTPDRAIRMIETLPDVEARILSRVGDENGQLVEFRSSGFPVADGLNQ